MRLHYDQATEDLLTGLLLDFVPIQMQSQDLFDNLLDRHRQLDRDADLGLVLPDAAGRHVRNTP